MFLFLNKFVLFFPISTTNFCFITIFSIFWLCVFATLVFSICFHLWVCLLVWFLSSFLGSSLHSFLFYSFRECEFWVSLFVPIWLALLSFTICLGVLSVCLFVCWFDSPFLSLFFYSVQLMASWCSSKVSSLNIQVQDVGPLEKSWPHGIVISKSSPKGLHFNTRSSPTQRTASSSAECPIPNN